MKTIQRLKIFGNHTAGRLAWMFALAGAVMFSAPAVVRAETAAPSSGRISGIYKVTSSTDPMFPATQTHEYFLDFGQGRQADKLSGSVAVSLRHNPNVQVRIMAWQYFPDTSMIALGNPFAEGSRNAVVRAAWRMRNVSNGVLLQRGSYQMVLHRPEPGDY